MQLSVKIKKGIEKAPLILSMLKVKGRDPDWRNFTRTQFNLAARIINRQVTKEVLANPELIETNLVIGRHQVESSFRMLKCESVYDFSRYLAGLGEYRVFNWISGKTLQSYWNEGEAKYIKLNVLLVFLGVPFAEWDAWLKETGRSIEPYALSLSRQPITANSGSRASLAIVRTYYLGNYFLYYQKTDGTKNIIKTPFILREAENGQITVRSVSEGHRYSGKVIGIRDGCLYINCQNLDFEEMEQYVFNIGLETKPAVLFGVSNTVSVKSRRAVALKNILVKQKTIDPSFDNIQETEIPFARKYPMQSEEAIVVGFLKSQTNNIILTPSCCSLEELKSMDGNDPG